MSQDLSYFSGPSTSGAGKERNKTMSQSGSTRREGSDHPMEPAKSHPRLHVLSAALRRRVWHGHAGSGGRSGAGGFFSVKSGLFFFFPPYISLFK